MRIPFVISFVRFTLAVPYTAEIYLDNHVSFVVQDAAEVIKYSKCMK